MSAKKSTSSWSKENQKKPAEKPISLAPLKFEEAVEGLLKVKPIRDKKPESEEG